MTALSADSDVYYDTVTTANGDLKSQAEHIGILRLIETGKSALCPEKIVSQEAFMTQIAFRYQYCWWDITQQLRPANGS